MNEYDVAVLLIRYAEKCTNTYSREQLRQIIRELKKRLNSEEIRHLCISAENTFRLTERKEI